VDRLKLVSMTELVNVQDAKARLSELLDRVERGEEIVIARRSRPVARLVAAHPPTERQLGFMPGISVPNTFFEALPPDEIALWEGR
jgi:prevent-host-death family protein